MKRLLSVTDYQVVMLFTIWGKKYSSVQPLSNSTNINDQLCFDEVDFLMIDMLLSILKDMKHDQQR